MKKQLFLLLLLLTTIFVSAQEKEKTKVILHDNLLSINLSYATKLSEKWFLRSKLGVYRANYINSIEYYPVSIEYHLTKKWKVFADPKLRYSFVKDDFYLGTQSNFSVLGEIGTRYDFTKHFFGKVIYEFNFVNKSYNQTLGLQGDHLKFGLGLKF